MRDVRRREVITLLGGAAAAWPLRRGRSRADQVQRIGVLMLYAESDPVGQGRAAAFRQNLGEAGVDRVGRNLSRSFFIGAWATPIGYDPPLSDIAIERGIRM